LPTHTYEVLDMSDVVVLGEKFMGMAIRIFFVERIRGVIYRMGSDAWGGLVVRISIYCASWLGDLGARVIRIKMTRLKE
jgi:hypothetical protein